ncbi:hypothetical protein ABEG17_03505 [Pedococcus sp. KACC 23699]|uniref:DUF559 domain-containing protein n=1 Tax=Pedococcus sp. KACC 23699 TaxID=3149228 RepID=A0AAU7JWH8_9MICO
MPANHDRGFRAHVRAFALALPDDVAFSHVTAARLHGLPTPRAWNHGEPLEVMRLSDRPRIERDGVQSHRGLERRWLAEVDGLTVTASIETWADLSTSLRVDDLVAVGDALVQPPHGIPLKDLRRTASDRVGRGAVALREAAALVRVGSASAWESKARVRFAQWGLPEPELNVDLHDDWGRWLARPDFVWRDRRVVGEYDGDQHRTDRRSWQYERERRAGLEDDGWTYVEMTSLSLTAARESQTLRARLTRLLL